VPVTDTAKNCVNAGNEFFTNNDFCLPYYRVFNSPQPFDKLEATARSICESQSCKSFLGEFANYLSACEAFGVDAVSRILFFILYFEQSLGDRVWVTQMTN